MCRDRRLVEQDAALGVDAAGQQQGRHLARLLAQGGGFLKGGDGVQIDEAIDALIIPFLQRHPVAQRAKIIAKGCDAGGLNA